MKYRVKTEAEFKSCDQWDYIKNLPFGFTVKKCAYLGRPFPTSYDSECLVNNTIEYKGYKFKPDQYCLIPEGETHAPVPEPRTRPQQVDTSTNYLQAGQSFDIQRVSSEINDFFQSNLTKTTEQQAKIFEVITLKIKEYANIYDEKVKQTLENIKQDLIREVTNGRSVITVNNDINIGIAHTDHPETENVLKSLLLYKKAMLVGPAGTGKTYMVQNLAEKLNLPFYKYSCSRDSSVHDLLGYKQPASEIYLETVFLNAYENGGIFLVDKIFVQTY